ncbi:FkbM family methyltransferase [Aeoliella sp.]|uniref:FkbM family methyltransferase n=1 Tax=Aeoliella sp. TaxID=2795800 RepID=UPI003CCBE239
MPHPAIWTLLRRHLGMKNLADYGQSRQKLLGLADLPIHTVLDIGANRGRHTRMYRRKFPNAKICAIEPVPHLATGIRKWAENQQGKVEVLNLALANRTGETEFFINRRASIWSTLSVPDGENEADYERIQVKVDTLDALSERLDLREEIVIKIDTEGADLEVLQGGTATLARSAAVIIEAVFYPTRYGDDAPVFEEIVQAMSEYGFAYRGNVRCCWSEGVCNAADALFVRRDVACRMAA